MGVLSVQGDVAEHAAALERCGAAVTLVRRERELDDVEALVLPGGESTAMHRLLRAFDLMGPLRERVAGGMPVLGSCAGLILLADRLEDRAAGQETVGGIDMTVRRNAFGRQVDSFECALDVTGVDGGPVHAVFIRAPQVVSVGPGVEVLARLPGAAAGATDRGEPGAGEQDDRIVAVRQGPLVATAFHPELSGDDRVHRAFVRAVATRAAAPAPHDGR
ncbi:pyridoxal 5'-phosphate synthase glutaminase subunit PdxT [Aquipuribacter sp. SD81]|uniref:pyridoxal 5'-phosphate synthase glutaminase subunit PdxT n=1 Tax=Aquipuribacter sp. SD81 TaxID=3127703 RepID=UPI003018A470